MSDKELDDILNEVKNRREGSTSGNADDFEEVLSTIFTKEEVEAISAPDPKPEIELVMDEEPAPPVEQVPDLQPKLEIVEESEETKDEEYLSEESDESVQPEEELIQTETQEDDEPQEYALYFADIEVENAKKPKNKKVAIILAVIILIAAVGAGVYFYFFSDKNNEDVPTSTKIAEVVTEETTVPDGTRNPLTGELGYADSALVQRPVAVVVENEYSTSSVRPQWGLKDADIVLEGESEYSTRLLLFWADYNKVPAQVGPARSARPPFIHFSQLFNAVFIHAGLSHSKDNYVGADSVFQNENIDHINLLSFSENGEFFDRDKSRTSTIEHTGFLVGTNTAKMLEKSKINTKLNESKFTKLNFNKEAQPLSQVKADEVAFKWSKSYCPKLGEYKYDQDKHKYTTTDFDSKYGTSDVEWENLIFLLDETEYIVKQNYKHYGNSETYCNYNLSGGKGLVCSEGTCVEITWGVKNSKLWLKDTAGNEVFLNPGKSYIGYGSSNHGGYYQVTGLAAEETTN